MHRIILLFSDKAESKGIYPIDEDKYNRFSACEMNMQGYYV